MRYPFKTKLLLLIAVSSFTLLSSCRDEIEVFQIERVPTFSFSNDNLTTQYAEQVNLYRGKTVVHYYDDGSSEVLNRTLITAKGINTAGNSFTVNIEFDLYDDGDLIGIYRPGYQKSVGGIYSFNYVEKEGNTYKSYDLDPSGLADDFIRIERQNMEEKLVLGDFFGKLQRDVNPEEKLTFFQGTFKDLVYVLQ
jgi:hypothetical protein